MEVKAVGSGVESQLLALLYLISIRLKKDRNSEWKKRENKIKKEGGKEKKEKKQGMERSEGREKRGNGQV